jgi:hypothetical protein
MRQLKHIKWVLFGMVMSAQTMALPFLKDMVGDRELPKPWGVGLDLFTMNQDYDVSSLTFDLPGAALSNPNGIDVNSRVQSQTIKLDAWVFPFLNVFGIAGHIKANTAVDLSAAGANIGGQPLPLSVLDLDYNGLVYGGGATLAFGGERWFSSITATFTETDLSGDFKASVSSTTIQPRIGLIRDNWKFYVGGFYLDTEEKHSGAFGFPGLGVIPFAVSLSQKDDWNYLTGIHYNFSSSKELSFEVGLGDRQHTLLSFTHRF